MKYPALQVIAALCKLLAWIILVVGVLLSITLAMIADEWVIKLAFAGGGIVTSAVVFLLYYGVAELFEVIVEIEYNTRDIAASIAGEERPQKDTAEERPEPEEEGGRGIQLWNWIMGKPPDKD